MWGGHLISVAVGTALGDTGSARWGLGRVQSAAVPDAVERRRR